MADDDERSGVGRGPGQGMGRGTSGPGVGAGAGGPGAGQGSGEPAWRDFSGLFEHEKLVVYQLARQLFVMTAPWRDRKVAREVREQLERSMVSLVSNIAEGAGKTARPDKRRFYEIAKGSATEAASQIEMIHLLSGIDDSEYAAARTLLLRIVKMLHGLCGAPRR